MPLPPLPNDPAGRELRRTLAPDEQVLAYAVGLGGALLVATDWRAIIIKVGSAATGSWLGLGRQNTSFRYGQITSVDLYSGLLGGGSSGMGFVVITSTGEPHPISGHPRDAAHLAKAKNVCPFDRLSEASFGQVAAIIRSHLYRPPG